MNTVVKNDSFITFADGHVIEICVPLGGSLYSRGIWFGDNPFNYVLPVFILQIVLSFCVSRAIYFILRPLKQPKVVCNILGGIILGPSVLGCSTKYMQMFFLPKELVVFHTFSTLGGYLFIFIACVKMDVAMITKASRSVWGIALSSIMVAFTVNLMLCISLHRQISGFVGGAFLMVFAGGLSETYFAGIAYAMNELNLLTSELGQLALSCAMINELIWWSLLPVAVTVGRKSSYFYRPILGLAILMLIAVYVLRPPILWIVRNTPEGKPVKQIFVVAVLLGALFMGFATQFLGGEFAAGIMAMGLIIPDGPPLGSTIVEKTELIISEVFLPLFYLLIGYNVNFSLIAEFKVFSLWSLIVLSGFLAKMTGCCLGSLFFNIGLRNALLSGLALNIRGTMEVMMFNRWRRHKLVNASSYTALVLANVAITAVVTPLLEIFYKPHMRLDLPSSLVQRVRSLQSTPRTEELRILSCIHREENVNGCIALFEASNPTKGSPLCVYMIHLVELVGRAAPVLVPYRDQGGRVMPTSSDRIMRAFTNYAGCSSGPVMIQFFTLIAPYKSMHETVCRVAQDRFIPLIIVPFHKNQQFDATSGYLRLFNSNAQAYASCTVGILVDRGMRCRLTPGNFSFKVALIFLGGPDDREALALVARMSTNPKVGVTLIRINFSEYLKEEKHSDRLLDEAMVKDFKAASSDNPYVACHEVVAVDSFQVMDCVRSLGDDYDLVVVGKRRGRNVRFEEEMREWLEYPELGVLGDVLASPDFLGGLMPVLVMQHPGEPGPTNFSHSSRSYSSMA